MPLHRGAHKFLLQQMAAVAELEAWNQVAAFPPWRREELERKVRYAFKRTGVERKQPWAWLSSS